MSEPFRHALRVRYNECDPQNVVFNANYLLYFDVGVTELWRAAIGSWAEMTRRGVDAVVVETNLRFRASARNDDVVQVRLGVVEFGRTSLVVGLHIVRDQEVLVEGRNTYVVMDVASWAKRELPSWLRDGLRRFAAPAARASASPSG